MKRLSLKLSLWLIDVAALFVPRRRRQSWRDLWRAELLHRWYHRADLDSSHRSLGKGLVLWSAGAFAHDWYLLRTEYTMDIIWQDTKFALRTLRRGKGLIAIAVVSLAIGIGANTSVFSAVDVFMWRPLPYPEAEELHMIWVTNQERGWGQVSFAVPDYLDMREESGTMQLAAFQGGTFNLSGDLEAERLVGRYVTPGFFQVLGVQPALGRAFTAEEGEPGNERVAIIRR